MANLLSGQYERPLRIVAFMPKKKEAAFETTRYGLAVVLEGRDEIRDRGHDCTDYGKANDNHDRELGRRRWNVCHGRAQKSSQILVSSSDPVSAASATRNAVIRS